jgi:hypothetical protein
MAMASRHGDVTFIFVANAYAVKTVRGQSTMRSI